MVADLESQAWIAQGMVIVGDVVFDGNLVVDGRVCGSVSSRDGGLGHVSVLANGYLEGNLRAQSATISGNVGGDVFTAGKTTILAGARVGGDVRYSVIELQLGAHVAGRIVRDDSAASGNVVVFKSSILE
jgi:cytoskeletal protein CcmA (bactofilin family)